MSGKKFYDIGYGTHTDYILKISLFNKLGNLICKSYARLKKKIPIKLLNFFSGDFAVWGCSLWWLGLNTIGVIFKAIANHYPVKESIKEFWAGANDSCWEF